MPITPTNRTKSTTTFVNKNKVNSADWGDSEATWGDLLYSWGASVGSYINRTKSTAGLVTITAGEPMGILLSITYPTTTQTGTSWINKNKS